MLRLILTCSLATTLSPRAFAESRDRKLLRESAIIAARVTAEEKVRGYLDRKAVERAVSKGLGRAAPRVGSAFVFAVDIGMSLSDFRKADSDKGRLFAGANTIASTVGLAFPIAGIVAKGALAVVGIVDASLSADHLKRMARIFARINELQTQTAAQREQVERSQKSRLEWSLTNLAAATESITAGRRFLAESCTDPKSFDRIDSVDGCVKSLIQIVAALRSRTQIEVGLIKGGFVTFDDEASRAAERREIYSNAEQSVFETLDSYSKMSADVLRQADGGEAKQRNAKLLCTSLARRLTLTILAAGGTAEDLGPTLIDAQSFVRSPCLLLETTNPDVDDLFERTHQNLIAAIKLTESAR